MRRPILAAALAATLCMLGVPRPAAAAGTTYCNGTVRMNLYQSSVQQLRGGGTVITFSASFYESAGRGTVLTWAGVRQAGPYIVQRMTSELALDPHGRREVVMIALVVDGTQAAALPSSAQVIQYLPATCHRA